MKKFLLASAVLALLGISATVTVLAQPPEDERPPRGDRPDGPPPEDGEVKVARMSRVVRHCQILWLLHWTKRRPRDFR